MTVGTGIIRLRLMTESETQELIETCYAETTTNIWSGKISFAWSFGSAG
jgi:hypothetical protein